MITPTQLAYLKENGSISTANLMGDTELLVQDDSTKLKTEFFGLKRIFYYASVLGFVAPYLLFTSGKFIQKVRAGKSAVETEWFISQLWRFVSREQEIFNYQLHWLVSLSIVFVILAYHSVRYLILKKVMSMEERESLRGVSSSFSFNEPVFSIPYTELKMRWKQLFALYRVLFLIATGSLVVHLLAFACIKVPK